MSLLSLHFSHIKYSKVPALRNALKAYEEDRLNDALEILRASQGDLAPKLPDTEDLFALLQESRGFVDALADAIETFQNFPHLASGYNRASEIYMQKGQGLHATEVYEAGLEAIGEDGDPQQRTLLQNHRHEMELKYRDFIALLPLEITERIFQKLYYGFRVDTCTDVSTAWLPKAAYNTSSLSVDYNFVPPPVVASRLLKYIDTLGIKVQGVSYLVEFFGRLKKEPFVGKLKRLTIEAKFDGDDPVDLHKIMAPGLTRVSHSLASLRVDAHELTSPMDLLAACPNLTSFTYSCISPLPSVQKTIPQRDKLTHLVLGYHCPYPESFVREVQSIIKATPNVRFARFSTAISDVLRIVPQHWRKLRDIHMNLRWSHAPENQKLEGEDFLSIVNGDSDLPDLYGYICQERMRLSRLKVTMEAPRPHEITPVHFPVLKYLSIYFFGLDESLLPIVLELVQGAVETLEELVLTGIKVPPETYEILARTSRLERLYLDLVFFDGIEVYLEHLASLGTSCPLKYITIHDWALDENQRTNLATRIPTLKEIVIMSCFFGEPGAKTLILPLLEGLVHSKSQVERISLPEYAMTTRVIHTLSKLSELRELDAVKYYLEGWEYFPLWDDENELESSIPGINIEVYREHHSSYDTYNYLKEEGLL